MKAFTLMTIGCAMALGLVPAAAGPLHDAARKGDGAMMQQLLRDGADINEQDETGQTALFAAASQGNYSVHDQLLLAGADVSIRDNDGLTVLHAAASGGDAGVIAGLIGVDHRSRRVELDDHDNARGVTALAIAVEQKHGDLVAYLVSHGADPNIPDKAGLTALTKAGQAGDELTAKLLLRTGGTCQDIDAAWKARCDELRAELGL